MTLTAIETSLGRRCAELNREVERAEALIDAIGEWGSITIYGGPACPCCKMQKSDPHGHLPGCLLDAWLEGRPR